RPAPCLGWGRTTRTTLHGRRVAERYRTEVLRLRPARVGCSRRRRPASAERAMEDPKGDELDRLAGTIETRLQLRRDGDLEWVGVIWDGLNESDRRNVFGALVATVSRLRDDDPHLSRLSHKVRTTLRLWRDGDASRPGTASPTATSGTSRPAREDGE